MGEVIDIEEAIAADRFRRTMEPEADGMAQKVFPWWHGWALVKAFQAGAAWERGRRK